MKVNRRLISEVRYAKTRFILAIFLGFMAGVLGILQAFGLSKIINQVFLQNSTLSMTKGLILILLMIVVLRACCAYFSELNSNSAAGQIKQILRQRFFTQLYALGPAYLTGEEAKNGTQTGELVNLSTEGFDALDSYFSQYIPQAALAVLVPVSILILVFPIDPLSGFILLITAPLLPLFMYLIGNAAETLTRRQWLGLSRMSAYFLDILQGLTTLKSLGRSKDQVKILEIVSDQYRLTTMGVLRVTFLSALALEMIGTLSTAVVAVEIGLRLLYGKMAFEQALFILLLTPEFYLPLRLLATRFHGSMAGVEAAKGIYTVIDTPLAARAPEHYEAVNPGAGKRKPPSIIIRGVNFTYPNSRPILDDASVEIPAGRMTALIGESGQGKTTLAWLLMGFLHPQGGEILVDGKNLNEIPIDLWLQELAWVPQSPYLFNDTVAANIALARPDADRQAVEEAARLAHADEFIHELPQGYETVIGEKGARLSSGQAQRIALARAFLKDAPLLILDEATSHLDPITDTKLQESIQRLAQERTVLVIAHRKNTIARANRVVTLNQGRIEITTAGIPFFGSRPSNIGGSKKLSPTHLTEEPTKAPAIAAEYGRRDANHPRLMGRIFNIMAPFWPRIGLSVILGFATIASGIGLMATSAYIISAAALHPSIAELQVAIVGVRFFGISRGVFRYLERLVSHDVTFRLLARWRVRLYEALEPLAPARLMSYHSGDLLARMIRDIGTLESFYVRTVNPPIVAILVSAAVLLFMRGFSDRLMWVLLAFLLLAGVALPIIAFFLSRKSSKLYIPARGSFVTLLVDSIQGMADTITNNGRKAQLGQMERAGDQLRRMQNQTVRVTALQSAVGTLLSHLAMVAVLITAIEMVSAGQLKGVMLGVITLTALTCFEAIQPLPQVAQNLETNRAAAGRLYELVDTEAPVKDPNTTLELPDQVKITFQDVNFHYTDWQAKESSAAKAEFGLKNISLSLPPGKHIAIIGPSGSGKTTLANMLMRYLDYEDGSIRLGDNELRNYRQEDIYRLVSYISQEPYLFCATIKDNLLIAYPGATMKDIHQAAEQAQLHEFVQALPEGYKTWIGEHGMRLSAGERQRLAISRAFLRNSPVLILDEPTANLDPINEQALLDAIHKFSKGRSMLYITQNMTGLEAMDEIIVMQDGKIAERGQHEELIANGGLYRLMWDLYHQIV